tara:strand:- start:5773 stop:7896 length:2124 start_codon:yes stop_codon:yes gene_type:complete
MAIYRPDQAQLSFASEGAQGADSEMKVAPLVSSGARAITTAAYAPGTSVIAYDNLASAGTPFVVGDVVIIGVVLSNAATAIASDTKIPWEVRRVEYINTTASLEGELHLDRPLAFNHDNNTRIAEVSDTANSSAQEALSVPSARFMPGAYTSVTVPDLTPTLEPKYFLGNTARRNFTEVYRGTQAYSGSLGGVTALNGFMLRFGIGNVRSCLITDSDFGLATFLTDGTHSAGDMKLKLDSSSAGATVAAHDTTLAAGAIVQIIDSGTVESGSVTGSGYSSSTILADSAGDFENSGVQVGDIIYNTTSEAVAKVLAVTSATQLTIDSTGLVGGNDAVFAENDTYLLVTQGTNSTNSGANTGTITGTYRIARQMEASSGVIDTIFLESPLKEDYADDSYIITTTDITTNVFQHVITEANRLPTLTWHLRMLDSDEGKPFIRRSVGGMVDSLTLNADEGGMLMVGWDTVNFMGTVHNLQNQKTVNSATSPLYSGDSAGANLPGYALLHDIDDDEVDFITSEPYYFSEGTVYIGGAGDTREEFARVRDFSIGVSNATEQRYYISSRHGNGRRRGPNEMREGRREYTFSATISLNDSLEAGSTAGASTDIGAALELYKQLILEGNYGDGSQGFNVRLTFIRGTNDTMVIDLPGDSVGSRTAAGNAATALGQGGVYLRSAPHDISEEATLQTSIDCVARNMKIVITDNEPVYP